MYILGFSQRICNRRRQIKRKEELMMGLSSREYILVRKYTMAVQGQTQGFSPTFGEEEGKQLQIR